MNEKELLKELKRIEEVERLQERIIEKKKAHVEKLSLKGNSETIAKAKAKENKAITVLERIREDKRRVEAEFNKQPKIANEIRIESELENVTKEVEDEGNSKDKGPVEVESNKNSNGLEMQAKKKKVTRWDWNKVLFIGFSIYIMGPIIPFFLTFFFLKQNSEIELFSAILGIGICMQLIGLGILILSVIFLSIERYKEYKTTKQKPRIEESRDRLLEPLIGILTGIFSLLFVGFLHIPEFVRGYQHPGSDIGFEIFLYTLTGILGITGGILIRMYTKIGGPLLFFGGFLYFLYLPLHPLGILQCLAGILAFVRKPLSKEYLEEIKSKLR